MKWSYRLGHWFGIGVDVHATFLLLLGWVAWRGYSSSGSLLAMLGGIAFVLALFSFVVMHEYGHALTARRFGIRTRRITLYPIGGVAMLEGMPRRPRDQLWIAIAGPAVNFALAALVALLMWALGQQPLSIDLSTGPAGLLEALLLANLLMGSFNLLPALPMDGGRVLRALLEMRIGPLRATHIAARIARVVAVGMGIFAFTQDNPVLIAISVMVWFMAGVERRQAAQLAAMGPHGHHGHHGHHGPHEPGLVGSSPTGPVPRARPPSAYGPGVVVEVVEGPGGPRVRFVRQ